VLAAGLDGIENDRDPGKPLHINMYEEGHTVEGYKQLPKNLLDALRLLYGSDVLRDRMGNELIDASLKLKNAEWNDYASYLSGWEREHTWIVSCIFSPCGITPWMACNRAVPTKKNPAAGAGSP